MKRIFTFFAMAVVAMTTLAADYTDQLAISISGFPSGSAEATVSVNQEEGSDGLYTIVLKQFSFGQMLIGDVTMTHVKGHSTDGMGGYVFFEKTEQDADITNGGDMALLLGNKVHVTINEGSCMNSERLYLSLSMPITMMGSTMDIAAEFGTNPFGSGDTPDEPADPAVMVDYTDQLVVNVAGQELPAQEATIAVGQADDGTYTLALKNFSLEGIGGIGTIKVRGVQGTVADGYIALHAEQTVTVAAGDDADTSWTMAGVQVPVVLDAQLTADKLYAVIDINFMGQLTVKVVFGTPVSAGIKQLSVDHATRKVYDVNGRRLNQLGKGLNIVCGADGHTIKVVR